MSDEEMTGRIYAVNVPGVNNWEELSESRGAEIVKQYRWIYVNASLKGNYAAKDEATKLSNAFNQRPMVHVYLSRTILDGNRDTYPGRFHASMETLISAATADDEPLLVTGRSYGVHQALRAACKFNKSSILVLGIAPAFGAFGNGLSDNVKQYISDVETTRCRYGIVASRKDSFTWKSGGAAYRRKRGYRGDNDVGRAIEKNRDHVHIEVIDNAKHAPIDEYLRHKAVRAVQRIVSRFELNGLSEIVNGVQV